LPSHIEIVQLGYEAFAGDDPTPVLRYLDDHVQWQVPAELPYGGTYSGPEEVLKLLGGLGDYYTEHGAVTEAYHDAGDTVIVQGRHFGKVRGGEKFESGFAAFYTFRNGKVAAMREYVDAGKVIAIKAVFG
jgi:ketosteroid isomerase-like protein